MVERYTNYGGETIDQFAELTVYLPNTLVHITGIDEADCYDYFIMRREEFRRVKGVNLDMYTSKLQEYIQQKREILNRDNTPIPIANL